MRDHHRKHIRLVCSCDRYNYGDLLFPIVTRSALTDALGAGGEYDFDPYGMARSDLSAYGAFPARSGLSILLTPIGRIHSFEDDAFLASLCSEMGGLARVLTDSAGVYDIAYTLASARLLCGTSLHGVVTALTCGVPFVPLQTEDPKLRNNLESWQLGELFPPAPAPSLAAQGLRFLEMNSSLIAGHSARLRLAAEDNMKRLAACISTG